MVVLGRVELEFSEEFPVGGQDPGLQVVDQDQDVGAGVQRAGPNDSTCSSRSRAITLTCDVDSRAIANEATSLSVRAVGTPSR